MNQKLSLHQPVCILAAVFILVQLACSQPNIAPGSGKDLPGTIIHNGLKRTYWLHIPPPQFAGQLLPLVFALHGGGGSGRKMAGFTGFNRLADREGFMVAYPDGVEKHWNDGRDLARYRAQRENIDDVGFIAHLMDTLEKDYPVDPGRIYVTGASNGALMSYRLACELTDRIAAIAPVIWNFFKKFRR